MWMQRLQIQLALVPPFLLHACCHALAVASLGLQTFVDQEKENSPHAFCIHFSRLASSLLPYISPTSGVVCFSDFADHLGKKYIVRVQFISSDR